MMPAPAVSHALCEVKDVCVQVISTARTCNLIIIVLDCLKPMTHKKLIEHELEGAVQQHLSIVLRPASRLFCNGGF
jgi:ribosome-interacting GTPase 1